MLEIEDETGICGKIVLACFIGHSHEAKERGSDKKRAAVRQFTSEYWLRGKHDLYIIIYKQCISQKD